MKGGGKGAGAGAAAAAAVALVLLVAVMQHADAAVARRLGTGGVPVTETLSGPKPDPCTHDPNNPGQKCQGRGQQEVTAQKQEHSSPVVSVGKETSGPNPCTFNPNDPTGTKCHPPPTAP